MSAEPALDRLSGLLQRFRVGARLSFAGTLCGVHAFPAQPGQGALHVLRRGSLEVTHPGRSDLPRRLRLQAPAVLFYPRPATHLFHNPPVDGSDFTCALVDFDGGERHPLARALPPLIALPLETVEGLEDSLRLLFAETTRVRCGHRLLADRLFEVVLIQLLRWLLDHPAEAGIRPGLITGLSDPRLARALVAMHEAPGAAWSLQRLAGVAGMSRTSFATTFKAVVGQTPADYLAQWRMALAQVGLREGVALKLLADELGYANPSALSRAFSARTGLAPRDWVKRMQRGVGADAASLQRGD
ncbi:AraC family transcriptional regulator [Cognatiluteimonas weifangensis]|uniref:AraC family transcriptional regulator n=1 Tax=Cognatiluteimonas weifangensis TaxID=2303539 RepID=A0A372DMH2_9GAMM|nr:AraC family transcriptional regulator [Luteimonas weifangensis]RFP60763.1 AraC family transcriptional regulator [Luteimonas weifangensis]